TLFDALNYPYFGEREAIKLAFDDHGSAVDEQASPHDSLQTAQAIDLRPITVPNTLRDGIDASKILDVTASDVIGSIDQVGGVAQPDYYSFQAKAGDILDFEVLSSALFARLGNNTIDSVLDIYDASTGDLVPYYSSVAENDNSFQSTDSNIIDLLI